MLSPNKGKKFKVVVTYPDKSETSVHFGDSKYKDYSRHHDKERKERYLSRHEPREDWSLTGVDTPGFWSRWILWNQPSVKKSIKDLNRRFYNALRVNV